MISPEPTCEARPTGGAAPVGAAACLGAVLGGFAAALVVVHRDGLAEGAIAPGASWWGNWRVWLPVWVACHGLARLAAVLPRLCVVLGLLAAAVPAAFASAAALGVPVADDRGLLIALAAGLSGFAVGRLVDVVRAGRFHVVAPSMVAAAVLLALGAELDLGPAGLGVLAFAPALAALAVRSVQAEPGVAAGVLGRGACWLCLLGLAGWFAAQLATAAQPAPAALLAAAAVALVGAALAARRIGVALGASVVAALWPCVASSGAAARHGTLAERAGGAVVYRSGDQEIGLWHGDALLAAVGPDRTEEPLLLALLHALSRAGDRVLLVGEGSGRIAGSLDAVGDVVLDVAPTWPLLEPVRRRLRDDGPVASPEHGTVPGAPRRSSWQLVDLPAGSRQLVALGEPFGPATVHRAGVAFQARLRHVVGDGVVCQPVALDRVPVEDLARWFDAARVCHRWNGLYAVGNGAVLVSAGAPPRWRDDATRWSDEARWALHAAHLGGLEDLDLALLGTLGRVSDAAEVRDVAQLLLRSLELPASTAATAADDASVLRRWRQQQAAIVRAKAQLLALPDDAAGRAEAQAIAARTLPFGAPAAWLQAALGLPGDEGITLCDPAAAVRRAHAIDPTFLLSRPAVFRSLPEPSEARGALQDLARVDVGPRLAQRCAGDSPLAVALRARFPSRCARALVASLAGGPLEPDASEALRELADPFVLAEAARVLVPLGRWSELLAWWRGDLPAPSALSAVLSGGRDDRLALARALRGRREPSCLPLFAGLFLDGDVDVRRAAAAALPQELRTQCDFDPEGEPSSRLDAADRLRALHNRKP